MTRYRYTVGRSGDQTQVGIDVFVDAQEGKLAEVKEACGEAAHDADDLVRDLVETGWPAVARNDDFVWSDKDGLWAARYIYVDSPDVREVARAVKLVRPQDKVVTL